MSGHFRVFDVTASALSSELKRSEVLSTNIANVNSTRTPEGGPYRRKEVVFATKPIENSFESALQGKMEEGNLEGVSIDRVYDDPSPFLMKFDPTHPDAGTDGYVRYPNVNIVTEMVNLMNASKVYGANVTVLQSIKNMISKAFEIGR